MVMAVWVDSWQMQCCGKPFHLGGEVAWTLQAPDLEWLQEMLGTGQAADAAEEHHGGVPDDTEPTRGTVTGIAAVHCRVAPEPGKESGTLYPVPGSGVLTDVDSADGWTADREGYQFVGYLVQLDLRSASSISDSP
jgi:hypothetical protein